MRILLADDHQMMRDGLRAILEKAGLEVVGEAANGRDAVALARQLLPDIVVMDISMPELNGIDATRKLVADCPNVKVVGLSMNADRRYVISLFGAGAVGYLVKSSAADELIQALTAVAAGGTYVSAAVAGDVEGPLPSSTARSAPAISRGSALGTKPLSPREREVLQLLAEGHSSKDIGALLQISSTTVETHRRQIMDKLNLRTIAELTKYAIREGITSIE